jgi:Na+-translocating ferredoxin:NAD+ oxidoreductase subunit D
MENRSPYIVDAPSVSIIMLKVLLALIPGIALYVYVFGPGVIINIFLASFTVVLTESAILSLRKLPVKPFIFDGSGLVTAWLLALSIPSIAPWWIIVLGTLLCIIFGKHLYGGLGYNLFNPAMVGYAILLISFPSIMTHWQIPLTLMSSHTDWLEQVKIIFNNNLLSKDTLDAISSATPLDYIKTQLTLHQPLSIIKQEKIFGFVGGTGLELINLGYLAGGLYLLKEKIISWHLPVAFLSTLFITALIFNAVSPDVFASPLFHIMSGGSMLCAFFIITDPVSAPTTPRGKIYFGMGIALLVFIIRIFGGYPEGIAFAVLLFNICAPLIDSLTQPRIFGHK